MYTPVAGTVDWPVEFLPHGRKATYGFQVPSTPQVQILPAIPTPSWIVPTTSTISTNTYTNLLGHVPTLL